MLSSKHLTLEFIIESPKPMDPRVIAGALTLYSLDHLFFFGFQIFSLGAGGGGASQIHICSQIIFIVLHNSIISLMILFDPAIKNKGQSHYVTS
jgi:hypothetical protein